MIVIISWLWTIFGLLSGESFIYLLFRKKAQNITIIGHICLTTTFGFLSTTLIMFLLSIFRVQSVFAYVIINLSISIPGFYCLWKYPPHFTQENSRNNRILNIISVILIVGFLIYMSVIIGQYENITNGDAYFFIGQAVEIMHYKPNVLNQYYLGSYKNLYIGDFFLCIYLFLFNYSEAIIVIKFLPVFFALIALLGMYGMAIAIFNKRIIGIFALLFVFASKVFSFYLFSYSRHSIALIFVLSFNFLIFNREFNNFLIGLLMGICTYLIHTPSLVLIVLGYSYFYISTMISCYPSKFTYKLEQISAWFGKKYNKIMILGVIIVLNIVSFHFSNHTREFHPMNLADWNNLSINALLSFFALGYALYIIFFKKVFYHNDMLYAKTYAFFTLIIFTITNNIYWWNLLTGMPYNAIRYAKYYEFGLVLLLCPLFAFLAEDIKRWYILHLQKSKISLKLFQDRNLYFKYIPICILFLSIPTSISINTVSTYFIDEWSTKTPDDFIKVLNWMRINTKNESIVLFPYEHFPRFQNQYQSIYFYDYFVLNYKYAFLYLKDDNAYKNNSMKYQEYIEWVYTGFKAVTPNSGISQTLLNDTEHFYTKIDYIILYTSYSPYLNELMTNDTLHFTKIYEIDTVERAYWNFYITEYPPHNFKFCVYEVLDE